MEYTVDYFIRKFSAIPEDLWCEHNIGEAGGKRCANGHTFIGYCAGEESEGLRLVFLNHKITIADTEGTTEEYMAADKTRPRYSRVAEQINNGNTKEYQQPTPKERILAALYDIKKLHEEQVDKAPKTIIKYVSVPTSIKKELVLN